MVDRESREVFKCRCYEEIVVSGADYGWVRVEAGDDGVGVGVLLEGHCVGSSVEPIR